MTWITRSLTRVGDFFASIYIRGTSVYSPSRRTFVESDQNLKRIFRRNPVRLPRPTPHFFVHLLQVLLPMTVCGRGVRPRRRPTCPTPHFFLIVCGRCVRPLRRPTLSHALFLCIPVTGVTPPDCVPCPTPHCFVCFVAGVTPPNCVPGEGIYASFLCPCLQPPGSLHPPGAAVHVAAAP